MRAAAYARYSTEKQTENSIDYQLDKIREYCQEHGITITATFTDEAESGTNTERSGFQAMVAAAERREFEAVVIYDITRGSRDVGDWFSFRKKFLKEDHRYVTKAAYVVLGITMDGRKDILGVWIGEHESSKFWLNVLNDLKSRGVLDVYLFCTDGLCGMMQAIQAVYPKSRLQRCIVHQIRSSTRYVSYKDIKKLVADLKKIYTAVTLEEAEENLRSFGDTWRSQYPSCVKNWEDNWDILSTFYEYPTEIRKIIYTTNIIEGLNRQFRQITKNKSSFTNDDSLRRMLYLASQRIVKRWHARYQNWDMVLSQLELLFAGRKTG